MRQKNFKISLFFCLLLLTVPTVFAKADTVTVTVQMGDGDATITLQQGDNGTITIIYNGVDILNKMTTRRQYNQLRTDLYQLAQQLDTVFSDIYGKLGFLAYVTGVNSDDNSTVALTLKAGNMTIVDFLNQIFTALTVQDSKLQTLRVDLVALDSKTETEINNLYDEIKANRDYYETQLLKLDEKVTEFQQTNEQRYTSLFDYAKKVENVLNSRIDGLTLSFWALSAVCVFQLLMLVWVARWKAQKTKP